MAGVFYVFFKELSASFFCDLEKEDEGSGRNDSWSYVTLGTQEDMDCF